jgi:hypothetical protein
MADLCKDALAAYVTALRSNTSSYDRFVGDEPAALSASARRGLDLFRGRAACAECHLLGSAGERAPFRDGKFHNTGVAWLGRPQKEQRGRIEDMLRMNNGFDPEGTLRARLDGDPGRGAHDPRLNATRTFKTPTLRDVARHAPYMHDGALPTLAAVVRHYAGGCGDDAKRDPRLKGFEASDADVADLVAFLESLTSETRPGLAESPWVRRVSWTRLRFVDATGRPLAGLKVTATPAGDLAGKQSGAPEPFVVTTDDAGQVKFNTTPFTHVRLSLADGLALHDGAWVPDTCHETTLVVSTAGTARLALVLPSGLEAPDELRLWRRTARGNIVFLDDFAAQDAPLVQVEPAPWSFVRHGSMKIDGKSAALYTGWCPEGSRKMLFRLAGQEKPQSVELVPDEILSVAVLP